jgi:hypothetical protein
MKKFITNYSGIAAVSLAIIAGWTTWAALNFAAAHLTGTDMLDYTAREGVTVLCTVLTIAMGVAVLVNVGVRADDLQLERAEIEKFIAKRRELELAEIEYRIEELRRGQLLYPLEGEDTWLPLHTPKQ